jgi:CheY-like chemotaxis protein
VTNGEDAVSRALGERFDVTLMDMQMPVLNGMKATRRLRELGFLGPIVALSAHAMQEDRQRFLDAGCSDYIAKPVDMDDLLIRLAAYRPRGEQRA